MSIKDLKEACEIFIRSDMGDEWIDTDHDIIYAVAEDVVREKVNTTDLGRLTELGWFFQDDCMVHHT